MKQEKRIHFSVHPTGAWDRGLLSATIAVPGRSPHRRVGQGYLAELVREGITVHPTSAWDRGKLGHSEQLIILGYANEWPRADITMRWGDDDYG